MITKPTYIILDIDGCCIDSSHRHPLWAAGDIDAYHAAHPNDTHIHACCALYHTLWTVHGDKVLFVTARAESQRVVTLAQLHTHVSEGIQAPSLLMRANDDRRPDAEMKRDLVFKELGLTPAEILFAVDDNESIIEMWKSYGIVSFKASK